MPALRPTFFFVALCVLAGCSTISTYDQAAYEHATSAKVDALALMDRATGDYSGHEKEIAAVQLELDKAYEYDRGRPLNEITLKQWDLLLSPEHDLFGGFLRDWKRKGQFKPVAISEKKKQVAERLRPDYRSGERQTETFRC